MNVQECQKGIETFNQIIKSQKEEFDDLYDYIINENSLEYEAEDENEEEEEEEF